MRNLTNIEIESLIANGNHAESWQSVFIDVNMYLIETV